MLSTSSPIVEIAKNKRAKFDYAVSDTYECGIVLVGTEVKSLRDKRVSFGDAYALLKDGELFLLGLKIEPYLFGTHENHESDRTRKLLIKKTELKKLDKAINRKGLTLVPLKIYFKNGRAKVLVGVAEGKSKRDKRDTIKKREAGIEANRAMRRGSR